MKDFFQGLTPDKILEAAELAVTEYSGNKATGRIYQLNSLENRVYEIEMESGDPVVAKFYRAGRWERDAILEEHEFLKDLKAAEIPVVAPLDLNTEGSQSTLAQTEDGLYFTVFPKARGRAPDELTSDQARLLGRLVARMHGVGETKKAPHRLKLTPDIFGLKPLEYLLNGQWITMDFVSRYENIARELVSIVTPLFENVAYHRIHGDCHLGNLLFDSKSNAFFLDFDDMVEGPAVQDIWLATPQYREEFIQGYEEMRKLDRTSLRLAEPLRALRIIHYSAWIARRWEDPFFQKIFTEFRTHNYWAVEIENLERILRQLKNQTTAYH